MSKQERFGTPVGIDSTVNGNSTLVAASSGNIINVVALLLTADEADTITDITDGVSGTVLFSHKHDANGGVNIYVPTGFIRTTAGNLLNINTNQSSALRGFLVYELVKDL